MDDIGFQEAWRAALEARGEVALPVAGSSMGARWQRARGVRIAAASRRAPEWGDVVLVRRGDRVYAHRAIFRWRDRWWTKGDARLAWDRPPAKEEDVLGVAVSLVPGDKRPLSDRGKAAIELMRALAAWPFLGFIRRWRSNPRRIDSR